MVNALKKEVLVILDIRPSPSRVVAVGLDDDDGHLMRVIRVQFKSTPGIVCRKVPRKTVTEDKPSDYIDNRLDRRW